MTFRSTQSADSKFQNFLQLKKLTNRIGGVLVIISVLASNRVDCGFEPWSGQTKDYKISICCFSAKHTALGWFGIRIICPSGVTYLPVNCYFTEKAL
jgi:hypothetical protein